MKFEIKYYWKFLTWLLIICTLLFLPANDLPTKPFINIPHFDKIVHFGLFFVLTLLAFRPAKQLTPNYYFWAVFICFAFAFLLETWQHKISASRQTDIYDFLANCTGICVATLIYHFFIKNKKVENYL